MFKDKLISIGEKIKNREGNNKKTIENLVVFIIILIVTVVLINYIWKDNNKEKMANNEISTKVLASSESDSTISTEDEMEQKLEQILSKMKGVGEVKVLITYSQTSKTIPMYSEDTSQTTTEETDSGGGTRTINESTTKKDIVYEENSGVKTPVTQSIVNPVIEGAVITAKGASNAEIKSSIIQAVEAATGLATHKIQVFEMN